MNTTRRFAINAVILTVTSLIMSSVSMSFTVYITGKIGSAGVGLYHLIMSVYRLGVTFATGGIGLATTRLVSEEAASGRPGGATAAVRHCLCYAVTLSGIASALLLLFSNVIALHWLGDLRTLKPIRILAFSLPALAVSSVLCGYFTAMRKVSRNSGVLLWEQFIKITLAAGLLSIPAGDGLENACCALVLSGTAAEIVSCATIFVLYLLDKKKLLQGEKSDAAPKGLWQRMLSIALPVALTSYLRSGLNSIEQMMIPWGLKRYGRSENAALSEYGIIGGMVMPVIMFPAVFISAFSGPLVTEISACRAVGDKRKINLIFLYVFRFTVLFSLAVAAILCAFGDKITAALYGNYRACLFVKLLAPLVCVMYLDSVTDSMLKGLDQQRSHMRYNIIDSALSVLLTVTLLPAMGINGYIIVIIVSETVNFFLSFRRLIKVTGFRVDFYNNVFKGAVAAALSVLLTRPMCDKVNTALLIGVSILIYVLLLRALGCVTREDTRLIKSGLLKR